MDIEHLHGIVRKMWKTWAWLSVSSAGPFTYGGLGKESNFGAIGRLIMMENWELSRSKR